MVETYYISKTYQQAKFKAFLNLIFSEEVDTNYLYTTNNNEITLLRYLGNRTNIKVPSAINGIPVTKIGCTCFSYSNNSITSVLIPEGIVVIE